jgi:hypothetical protein
MQGFYLEEKYLPTLGTPRTKLTEYENYTSSQITLRCLLKKRSLFLNKIITCYL